MGNRLSKIYTRTGDDGYTSLGDKQRLPKNHPRLMLLGDLDELNCVVGMLLTQLHNDTTTTHVLHKIQNTLFDLGGELCPPFHAVIHAQHVSELETTLDEWNATLPPLKEFLLPGGNSSSAICHFARSVCRRSERDAVTLFTLEPFNPVILQYLNRLSDLLFVLARVLARESNTEEIMWQHERQKKK